MTGDPIADVFVQLFEDLVAEGVHALDPVAREKRIREAVTEQLARTHAADPGPLRDRLDVIEQKHRDRLAAAARTLRLELDAWMMLPGPVHAAVTALIDQHDPQSTQ